MGTRKSGPYLCLVACALAAIASCVAPGAVKALAKADVASHNLTSRPNTATGGNQDAKDQGRNYSAVIAGGSTAAFAMACAVAVVYILKSNRDGNETLTIAQAIRNMGPGNQRDKLLARIGGSFKDDRAKKRLTKRLEAKGLRATRRKSS